MKSRETKQRDLTALTESLQNSKSAMVVSFKGLKVGKDQEFRNSVREAGAKYQVVKNTLARIAVKGTDYEQASEFFKGITAIAWTDSDPVVLSKAVSKFLKENADVYSFKTGVVDGRLVDLGQLTMIANLPSKEELISKLLYVINAQAQRLVTVINAVPRDLAVAIRQIGENIPTTPAEPRAEDTVRAPVETKSEADVPAVEETAEVSETAAAEAVQVEAAAEDGPETAAEAVGTEEAPAEAAEAVAEEKAE